MAASASVLLNLRKREGELRISLARPQVSPSYTSGVSGVICLLLVTPSGAFHATASHPPDSTRCTYYTARNGQAETGSGLGRIMGTWGISEDSTISS